MPPRRTSRLLAAGTVVAALGLALGGAGCGASATSTSSGHQAQNVQRTGSGAGAPHGQPTSTAAVHLSYRALFSLPAALQDPASAYLGNGQFVLLGGLDAADSSSAGVLVADRHGPLRAARLPGAQHDAQGAALNGKAYVFGGGNLSQYDHILSFDPSRPMDSVRVAGALPRPASDVAVTEVGGSAYVVGGFDGNNALDTVVSWRPGTAARVVAHLPVALRYAAVSAAGPAVLIIGGSAPSGASDAIYRFDPGSAVVRQIGRLPDPITHAGAATLGSRVYVVGGRGNALGAVSARVWSIDSRTGAVRPAGRLPQPLSDAGVLSTGAAIIVAGGHTAAGTQAAVGELVPIGTG